MLIRQLISDIYFYMDTTPYEEIPDSCNEVLHRLLQMQNRTSVAHTEEKPLTLQQLRKEAEAASAWVQAGHFVRHEEVKKQAENW